MAKIDDIKSKILKSTASLFMAQGYRKTSLRMIGQDSEISHTQVLYHFKNKSYLGSLIIKSYMQNLIETVEKLIIKDNVDSTKNNKLYWWAMHYLVLTNYKGFSTFFLEFMTDEQDAFVATVNNFFPRVYRGLFDLDIGTSSAEFLTDAYIIASIDNVMARLCIKKALKVEEAIKKLLNLDIIYGFRVELTEEEIKEFIAKKSLVEVVKKFNIERIILDISI